MKITLKKTKTMTFGDYIEDGSWFISTTFMAFIILIKLPVPSSEQMIFVVGVAAIQIAGLIVLWLDFGKVEDKDATP